MFLQNLKESVMITSFVMVMMLIIEYLNVQSKGTWIKPLQKNQWLQLIMAALLGITPGCLGTFLVVSMFTHNMVNFGALLTVMIATTGDEAFIMFSKIPATAVKLNLIIFFLSLLVGFIVNLALKKKLSTQFHDFKFDLHHGSEICISFDKRTIIKQLKNISFPRAILIFGLLIFIAGLSTPLLEHTHAEHQEIHNITDTSEINNHSQVISQSVEDEHGKMDWTKITFLITSLLALLIVTTVPDHFLQEHLWGHIIKKHFLKIFLWTTGTLVVIGFFLQNIEQTELLPSTHLPLLIAALVIGIIPISGPHLAFTFLFAQGVIPFSILFANSIVQDGHGALPLFAESKKTFVIVKSIKIIIGLIIGLMGYYMSW